MSVADRGELTAVLGASDLDPAPAFSGDVLDRCLRDGRPLHEFTPERR